MKIFARFKVNMDNPPELISTDQDLDKTYSKQFSSVLRIVVVGWIAFILLALFATTTLSFETGDSAGEGFYLFAFLSFAVLIISNSIAIVMGVIRIIQDITLLKQKTNFKANIENDIAKYIVLIFGILIASRIAFKILGDIW